MSPDSIPDTDSPRPATARPSAVARGGVQSLVYRIVELGAQGLMIVITARLLHPEGRGLYALASLTAMLCIIPLGSVWYANAVEISRRTMPLREILGAALAIAALGGAATTLVALAITPALGDRWWVVAFPAAVTPFLLIARYGEGIFQAVGNIHAVGLITVARVVVPLAFISAALFAGAGDRQAVAVWTLSLVVLAVMIYIPVRRMTGAPRLPRDRAVFGRLTRFGLKLAPGMWALLGTPRMGLIVLAILVSAEAVGVYSVAIAAGEVLYLTTYSLITSAFQDVGGGDRKAAIWLSTRAVRHGVLLAVVGSVVLVPATVLALPLVVGPGYGDVPLVLLALTPGIVAQAGAWNLSTFFTVHLGRPDVLTRVSIAITLLALLLGFALVPLLGIWGAAVASTSSSLSGAAMLMRRFRDEAQLPIGNLLPGRDEIGDYLRLLGAALRRAPAGPVG